MIDTILKYQLRNESSKEVEKPNRDNKTRNGNKEDTSKPSPNKGCFVNETNQKSRDQIWMKKQVHVVNQAVVKRNILECVRVGEKWFWQYKQRTKWKQ